jgi:uncharacterized protein (DUF2267 family)
MTKLGVLDSTVQKTHEWLRDIKEGLGFDNDHAAYAALRATLHCLRDLLGHHEVAHLGAQLPVLIRGIYYEGWVPDVVPEGRRDRQAFLDHVRHELRDHPELRGTQRVVGIVLGVLEKHVTPGEITKIVHVLPREIRTLWPEPADEADIQ